MGFALAVQIQLLAKAPQLPTRTGRPPRPPTEPKLPQPAHRGDTLPRDEPLAASARRVPCCRAGARQPAGRGWRSAQDRPSDSGCRRAPVLLGRLFGVVAWQHVSVELAAVVSLPTTTRRAGRRGFTQQHLLGSAAACAPPQRARAMERVPAGERGRGPMAGENIDRPTSARVPLFQVGVRAGIAQRLGRRAFLSAHADGLANLTRWTGSLDQVPVWTAPRFCRRATASTPASSFPDRAYGAVATACVPS